MLFPSEMQKVNIAFLSEDRERVLERLQEQGVVEVKEISGKKDILNSVDVDIDYLSSLFLRSEKIYRDFRGVMKRQGLLETLLGNRREKPVSVKKDEMKDVLKNAEKVVKHVERNADKINREMEENRKTAEAVKNDVRLFGELRPFDFDLSLLGPLKETFTFVGKVNSDALPFLKEELAGFRLYLHEEVIDAYHNILLVLGIRKEEEDVRKFLVKHDFEFFDLEGAKGKPSEILGGRREELGWLSKKRAYLAKKRKGLMEDWWDEIEKTYFILKAYRDRLRSLQMFQETKYVSLLEGWMPKKREWEVQEALYEATFRRVFFAFEDVEDAPTDLENPGFAEKFEVITGGFGVPSYKDADPTVFLAFLFPVFFGFMLGDILYGMIIILLSFSMRFYFRNKLSGIFSGILLLCGLSAICWGILFGNFMGNLLGLPVLWFDPTRNPVMLIIISLIFGLVHVNMGIVLSLMQNRRKKRPITSEISWFLVEAGGLLVLLRILGMMTEMLFYAGLVIFIAGVGMKVIKPVKAIGLISFFGNILSYVRLAAISLATSYIALTINHVSLLFVNGSFILSGFIFTAGHLFNCAISSVGAFVNSLRLHYVEFFSQFFEGGGEEFRPLKYEGVKIE